MAYLAETAEVYDCDDMTVSFRSATTVRARKLQHRTPVIGIFLSICPYTYIRTFVFGEKRMHTYNDIV